MWNSAEHCRFKLLNKRKGKRPLPLAFQAKANSTQLIIPVAGRCVAIRTAIRVYGTNA
jgi:hypothetical protein